MLNRREFCVLSAVSLAAAPLGAASASLRQGGGLEVRELREGVWAIIGGGGNSLAIRSTDGSILVDTKVPQVAAELLEKSSGVLGSAPSVVINTHHHGDHTGGNFQFSENSRLVGQANIRPRIQATIDSWLRPVINRMASQARQDGDAAAADALAQTAEGLTVDQFAADDDFDHSHAVEVGQRKLELTHIGNGHTDNDTVILMPNENILHMGDLFFNKIHAFMDLTAKSNSTGWRTSVRAALELCDEKTIVIPGHGELTDRDGLREQVDYFDHLEEVAERAIKGGVARGDLKLDALGDYQSNRGVTNLQIVFDELIAKG